MLGQTDGLKVRLKCTPAGRAISIETVDVCKHHIYAKFECEKSKFHGHISMVYLLPPRKLRMLCYKIHHTFFRS